MKDARLGNLPGRPTKGATVTILVQDFLYDRMGGLRIKAMEVRDGEPWPNRRGRSLFTSRDGRQSARESLRGRRTSASMVRPVDPQPLRATGKGTARRQRVRSLPSDDRCVVLACRCEAPDPPAVVSGLSVCARRVERLSLCGAAQGE